MFFCWGHVGLVVLLFLCCFLHLALNPSCFCLFVCFWFWGVVGGVFSGLVCFGNKTNLFILKCFEFIFSVSLPFSLDFLSLFSLIIFVSFFLVFFHVFCCFLVFGLVFVLLFLCFCSWNKQLQNIKLERILSPIFLFPCFGRVIHLTLEPSMF